MRKKKRFNLFDIFIYMFCGGFALICFYPMWYVFIVSIMPYKQYMRTEFFLLPPLNPTFEYYYNIFTRSAFRSAMFISISRTMFASVSTLAITAMMAYGVSKRKVKGMKLVNFIMIFTMFFGGGLIPYYILIKSVHLYNTFLVYIVPGLTNVAGFIIMRNYFTYSVPSELEDACVIDGANEVILFLKIVVPIAKPVLAAVLLFDAVANWNDWTTYLFFVEDVWLQPFTYLLKRLLEDPNFVKGGDINANELKEQLKNLPSTSLKMTTIVVAMLPIIMFYPFLQKHFTKGIMIGAIKE